MNFLDERVLPKGNDKHTQIAHYKGAVDKHAFWIFSVTVGRTLSISDRLGENREMGLGAPSTSSMNFLAVLRRTTCAITGEA